MLRRYARTPTATDREKGQILPIFALVLTALFILAALLFDGAGALVVRRQLQDAGDAAALAAVHTLPGSGCSDATSGPPRASVVAAAKRSISVNLPAYDPARVVVSCPAGWNDFAVRVQLTQHNPALFLGILQKDGIQVATTSTAVNGPLTGKGHSIITLNPSNPAWGTGNGCPSFLLQGSVQVTVQGDVAVNSACPAAKGGAASMVGASGKINLLNGATMSIVGDAVRGAVLIDPPPATGQPAVADPFAALPPVDKSGLPTRSTTQLTVGAPTVLHPGVYRGGLIIKSPAYLRPGIYYIDGGGVDVKGGGSLFSINASTSSTTSATWASDCTRGSCGVLIYNAGGTAMRAVNAGGNAIVKLRGYDPAADTGPQHVNDYRNMAIWQEASPVPSSTYAQPELLFRGGAELQILGAVYAPSAMFHLQGGVDGEILSSDVSTQFVVRDFKMAGDANLTVRYDSRYAVAKTDYGLVE